MKVPPVVAEPHAEAAVFNFNMLSATGTGILRRPRSSPA